MNCDERLRNAFRELDQARINFDALKKETATVKESLTVERQRSEGLTAELDSMGRELDANVSLVIEAASRHDNVHKQCLKAREERDLAQSELANVRLNVSDSGCYLHDEITDVEWSAMRKPLVVRK